MKLSFKTWGKVVLESFKKFFKENPFQDSAAIAYYAIFALPGIAIISLSVASSFYEYDDVRNELLNQIRLLMGSSNAEQIEAIVEQASISSDSVIMKIVGVIALVFSATTVFISLQNSLNAIWKIRAKPKKEIIKFLINRFMSLAMVVSIGFLVLVSLMADTVVAMFHSVISNYLAGFSYYLVLAINASISLGIAILIFAAIFKILPDAQIRWRDVWLGAIVTTLLFVGGKYLIGYYLSSGSLGDAYGAAGSLVALLAWMYYSVLILLFGAQFVFVYNKYKGRSIKPDKGAVAIMIEEVEQHNKSVTHLD